MGYVQLDDIHQALLNQDFDTLKELQNNLEVFEEELPMTDTFHGDVQQLNLSQSVVVKDSAIALYDPSPKLMDVLLLDEEIVQILVPKKVR